MNTRQLHYVITVAELRSFSEAATKLMVSQPSLSQYISKLEDEIGMQIFERTVPLKITYAGEIYLKSAKKILSEEAELLERLQDISGSLSGKIKIGTGYLNAISIVPAIVGDYNANYPNVQVEIYEDTEPKLKKLLDEGDIDLVIATSQFDSTAYEKVLLGEEPYLMAVPKNFGALGKESQKVEDVNADFPSKEAVTAIDLSKLENIPLVRLQPNTYMRELVDSLYDSNYIQPKSTIECTTAMGAYGMAKKGVGATLIPYSLYKTDYCYNLNYYSIKEMKRKRKVSLIYCKNKYLNSVTKEFINTALGLYTEN